jgi:catechol 2,3-dioxygenase-like lactoylglutathione lyase family enzyme
MLANMDLVAFIPTRDFEKSRLFYQQTLGLSLVSQDPFALVFNANGTMLRITNVATVKDFKPQPFTVLGWRVESVEATVRELVAKGVQFERLEGMNQDNAGIWVSPAGAQIAWFKDPDGNLLSVTQFSAAIRE